MRKVLFSAWGGRRYLSWGTPDCRLAGDQGKEGTVVLRVLAPDLTFSHFLALLLSLGSCSWQRGDGQALWLGMGTWVSHPSIEKLL